MPRSQAQCTQRDLGAKASSVERENRKCGRGREARCVRCTRYDALRGQTWNARHSRVRIVVGIRGGEGLAPDGSV